MKKALITALLLAVSATTLLAQRFTTGEYMILNPGGSTIEVQEEINVDVYESGITIMNNINDNITVSVDDWASDSTYTISQGRVVHVYSGIFQGNPAEIHIYTQPEYAVFIILTEGFGISFYIINPELRKSDTLNETI